MENLPTQEEVERLRKDMYETHKLILRLYEELEQCCNDSLSLLSFLANETHQTNEKTDQDAQS